MKVILTPEEAEGMRRIRNNPSKPSARLQQKFKEYVEFKRRTEMFIEFTLVDTNTSIKINRDHILAILENGHDRWMIRLPGDVFYLVIASRSTIDQKLGGK